MDETSNPADAVNALADRFWDGILDLSPITATLLGYEQGLDRLDDPGPAGREKARSLFRETLATAAEIEGRAAATSALPLEERITLDILRVICDIELEQQDQRVDRLKVVDQMDGPQTVLPMLAAFQATDTPEKFDLFLARLADYPRFMAANAELVREGLAGGLTAARIVTERVIGQLERLLALPDEQSPVVTALSVPKESDRERLIAAVGRYVRPADRMFLDALLGKYREASRADPGLWSATNGEQIYKTQIRAWTSLDVDAAELHRIGLEQLRSIDGERQVIAREMGFGDDTKAARAVLLSNPAFIPESVEELLDRARGQIERALASAPHYFGRLPRAACEVRAVEPYKEEDAPAAYYYPPAIDDSRPGVYYVNTYDLPSRNYIKLASTSFHEAVPGHHFQIALQSEHPGLNAFRRHGSRMAGMAYVEGWGLYSERLADEMGLYLNPGERFGMLDGQAHRAARLVVDTGIHAFRWPRERSVAQLLEAGLSETEAGIETDRYICLPAQALAYKVGQREIERLRSEASARLGPAFDVSAFHDALLGHGTLPLATLAKELPGWLDAAG
ncbi:MAG: DUF885 domain-containing protein [Candidatus Limnocylindrales bacterium]